MQVLEAIAVWLIASAVGVIVIARWFRYQRDCDERDRR
jgi:hypothetical protein